MEEDNFFLLDEIDIKVFSQLLRRSSDFEKLNDDDKRILIWFIIKCPRRILSFVDYLGKQYEEINAANLFEDVEAIP